METLVPSLTKDPVDVSNPGAPMLPCSFIPRSRNERTGAYYFTLLYYHFLLLLIRSPPAYQKLTTILVVAALTPTPKPSHLHPRPMDGQLPADISKEPARPNTTIHYPLFSPHSLPMPTGQLSETGWKQLTTQFPDHEVIRAMLGICRYGAKIGYEGCRKRTTIHPNLSSANIDAALVTADLVSELKKNSLEVYQDSGSLPQLYMASPLGLADKSDGSKRRIHHLLYPTGHESSINSGSPELYGAIQYSGIEDAITVVQTFGTNCILIKSDFEAAFRHIPISPEDSPLLGFHWQNRYYAERFLPFGL